MNQNDSLTGGCGKRGHVSSNQGPAVGEGSTYYCVTCEEEAKYRAVFASSFRHHDKIVSSKWVGCFYCMLIFAPKSIRKWTDKGQTALCPICEVDSVIPMSIEQLDSDLLMDMHDRWFNFRH